MTPLLNAQQRRRLSDYSPLFALMGERVVTNYFNTHYIIALKFFSNSTIQFKNTAYYSISEASGKWMKYSTGPSIRAACHSMFYEWKCLSGYFYLRYVVSWVFILLAFNTYQQTRWFGSLNASETGIVNTLRVPIHELKITYLCLQMSRHLECV